MTALRKKKSQNDEDYAKRPDNQNIFRDKESYYEKLGFTDNMTYEKRSELRKECSRFIRFSYLIDFLALEALRNIYVDSVEELITKLEEQTSNAKIFVQKDKIKKGICKEPMFLIKIDFKPERLDEDKIGVR